MDTGRSEGKRTLRYKEEVDDEEEEEEEEEEEGEMGFGEDGRRKRVMTDLYSKRGSKAGGSVPPSCQVDNCDADLSEAKQYHRRHKVCEYHAKAPAVHIAGLQQRFCQQCSSPSLRKLRRKVFFNLNGALGCAWLEVKVRHACWALAYILPCAKAHPLLILFPNSMSYPNLMTQKGAVEGVWPGIMRGVAKV